MKSENEIRQEKLADFKRNEEFSRQFVTPKRALRIGARHLKVPSQRRTFCGISWPGGNGRAPHITTVPEICTCKVCLTAYNLRDNQ